MPVQRTAPSPQDRVEQWYRKLVVSLELADLADPDTRERLDSTAAKANNQGLRAVAAWHYAQAVQLLTAASEIWARLDHVPGQIAALNTRGTVYRMLGDYDSALADHHTALELAHDADLTGGEIMARVGLGAVLTEQEQFDPALKRLAEARELAADTTDNWGTAHVHRFLGRAYEARKEWDAALQAYGVALEMWRVLAAPVEAVEDMAGLARIALAQGYTPDAFNTVERLLEHLGEHGPTRLDEPLRVFLTIYRVLHIARQEDNARAMLKAAVDLLQRQATGLSDEARARFLATPVNHALRTAWEDGAS